MPKAKELLRFLHNHGYEEKRQKRSHRVLNHPVRPMLIVPFHLGDVPRGSFLPILRDAGFSEQDYFGTKKKGKL